MSIKKKSMSISQHNSIKDTRNAQRRISAAVVSSYVFKSATKLTAGVVFAIPPLIADGIHGVIDIFEHGVLVLAGRHARKADREKYPLDREPLIELLGLGIFLGLFFLGLSFFCHAIKTIFAVLVRAGWVNLDSLTFISKILQEISIPEVSVPWLAASILFVCFGITEIVFRFQRRLANEYGLREMEADAMELRSDGWIELAMAFGFTAGWITAIVLSAKTNSAIVHNFTSLVTEIILLALSFYLMKISIPEIYNKYQNLMNVALEGEKREQLENAINNRLPKNCTLLSPLTSFYRGEQLFVTGHIRIDRSVMVSSDMILSKVERTAKRFLSDLSQDIRVQFSPFFIWDSDSIQRDLDEVVRTAWGLSPECSASKAFYLLRKGNLAEAQKLIDKYPPDKPQEIALTTYVSSEVFFRAEGLFHAEGNQIVQKIERLIEEEDISLSAKIMLASWFLIYAIGHKNSSEGQHIILFSRNRLERLLNLNSFIPDIVHAEVSFALGYSWERFQNYDVQKTMFYYRQSEISYARSGIRSESDRLMNTWGHFETMLYSLGDAQDHLEVALDIRKLREDPLSLSFTYGCLGDLYSRLGNHEDANYYYTQDIDILKELNVVHLIPLVMGKHGKAKIRWGLTEKNPDIVFDGITLCEESGRLAGIDRRETQFFARKGQLKGWLGLTAISDDRMTTMNYHKRSSALIESLEGKSTYEKAFLLRLKGRYFGLSGDIERATKSLNKAALHFDQMKEPNSEIDLSLQSIACRLESLRHKIANSDQISPELGPVAELETFLDPLGGMLGEVSNHIRDLLTNIKNTLNCKTIKKEDAITDLDQLIWLIEG